MRVLLRHSADLELVVLDSFKSYAQDDRSASWLEVDELAHLPRLKACHITRSRLFESDFRLLVDCCPSGTVLRSSFIDHDESRPNHEALGAKELSSEFPNVETSVRALGSSEDPTADWDILDWDT
jgi:hypothetical protein